MTISEFMAKWRKVELKERSAAQEHFIDLCNVFDHQTPAAADPILRPLADNIRCMDAILDCGTGVRP